jgi:hypothetical protein
LLRVLIVWSGHSCPLLLTLALLLNEKTTTDASNNVEERQLQRRVKGAIDAGFSP